MAERRAPGSEQDPFGSDPGRSGKATVLVLGLVMLVVAVTFFLAARSMSETSGHGSGEETTPGTTAP